MFSSGLALGRITRRVYERVRPLPLRVWRLLVSLLQGRCRAGHGLLMVISGESEVVTLFPDAMYHELPAQEVKIAMKRALDELQPEVVGVSGYGMTDSRAALQWCRDNGACEC